MILGIIIDFLFRVIMRALLIIFSLLFSSLSFAALDDGIYALIKTNKGEIIVELAYEKGIDIYFFISPSHARQWEVIAQLGLWEKWEAWKKEILAITIKQSNIYERPEFPIYDFSGYSQYSVEAVPRGDGQAMRWYSDSSHFKKELGTIVFQQMVNGPSLSSFGEVLHANTINNHLKFIRDGREKYILDHPKDISDIKTLIDAHNKY